MEIGGKRVNTKNSYSIGDVLGIVAKVGSLVF
jgi:hypothetical protein